MKYILLSILLFTFIGCVPKQMTKYDFAPQMYIERPLSILVLPPINKSTASDAKDYYLTTIAEPLTIAGYYVYPIEVLNDVFKQEGLSDTESMLNVPPQKFREFFGTDAVMYVTILKWNTSYFITAASVSVQIECEIKSSKTGSTLWYYNEEVEVNTTGDSGNAAGLTGLLIQAATTAINTALQDYIPIAKLVNKRILVALPFGKYNNEFNKDLKTPIAVKKKIAKK